MARYEPTFIPDNILGVDTQTLDVSYEPSDVSVAHPLRAFDRYPPFHAKPPGRDWPTLVCVMFSSFTYSHRAPNGTAFQLDAGSPNPFLRAAYELNREGIQVIFASVTVSRGGSTGNSTSEASYDPPNDLYEAAYTDNGVFKTLDDANFTDFDRPSAIKDVCNIVQCLKHNASTYEVDPDNIILTGSSAGAFSCAFAALQRDLAEYFSGGSDAQNAFSTKPRAFIGWNMPSFMPTMKSATSVGHAFRTIASASTPAALLNDVFPSATIDDTNHQWILSPLAYAEPDEAVDTLLIHDAPSISDNVTRPLSRLVANIETDFHGLRQGSMLRHYLPASTTLVFSPSPEYADQYAKAADRFGNVDAVLTQEDGNQQDELIRYIVDWTLKKVGLKRQGVGSSVLPYGASTVYEYEQIAPTANTYHRVMRANPNRVGPVRVQFQSTINGTQAQVRWTTDPSTPTIGVQQTAYSTRTVADGLGTSTQIFDQLELNIGGAELWVTRRAGNAASTDIVVAMEPTH